MTAQALLQARIDAQQDYDAVVYGLRSISTCGSSHSCVGVHAGQLHRAAWAAARALDREANSILYAGGGHSTGFLLKQAKDVLAERLKAAKAELKAVGGVRQLRLALAAGDETMAAAA